MRVAATRQDEGPEAKATLEEVRRQLPSSFAARYVLQRELGRGAMGVVLLARDEKLGRNVAIKVLQHGATELALMRFEQEARAAAALNHPNVIAVHDTGVAEGQPYIVSEVLEGKTLRDHLHDGRLPAREAVRLGSELLAGLCSSPSTASSRSWTSASPSCSRARAARPPPRPARCWARWDTCRRSSSRERRSTSGATSSAPARCFTRCSPAGAPSPALPATRSRSARCTRGLRPSSLPRRPESRGSCGAAPRRIRRGASPPRRRRGAPLPICASKPRSWCPIPACNPCPVPERTSSRS
ncbi:MAG: serine/threonine protein kinase [Deltaproteobacteria bacterium]|nr:MAG: serine/threonine protein kinase [Deltaproteobacteria bacterium]